MNQMIGLKFVRSLLLVRAQRSLIEISCFYKFSEKKLDFLTLVLLLLCFSVHLISEKDLCTLCLLRSPTKNSHTWFNQKSETAMELGQLCLSID